MVKDYHFDGCSITGEECDSAIDSCISCDRAKKTEKDDQEEKRFDLITFDKESNIKGIKVKSNRGCTIAMVDDKQLMLISEKAKGTLSLTHRINDSEWKTTHPVFLELKEAMSLSEPTAIITNKEKLGIFKYPDVIYLVAPLCEYP